MARDLGDRVGRAGDEVGRYAGGISRSQKGSMTAVGSYLGSWLVRKCESVDVRTRQAFPRMLS